LVDGNKIPKWDYSSEAVISGDARVDCIAAASIVAKVTRDREMVEFDKVYPGYGFAGHKGYPTKKHMQALTELGICPIHRVSYGPIKKILAMQ
jgi:ribonuclease HII